MDGPPLLSLAATALISVCAAIVTCHWWFGRKLEVLRRRLHKSEQARHAAHERSNRARAQINQLSQAIADLQRRHRVTQETKRARAELEQAVPAQAQSMVLPENGFAETQPM